MKTPEDSVILSETFFISLEMEFMPKMKVKAIKYFFFHTKERGSLLFSPIRYEFIMQFLHLCDWIKICKNVLDGLEAHQDLEVLAK